MVLDLRCGHRYAPVASRKLRCCRSSIHAVRATVKADPIAVVLIHHVPGVNVVNNRGVHVRDARVVEILATSPVTAIEAGPGITESIGNATVEADYWTPVTGVPGVEPIGKFPVPGSPQKTHLWRKDPNAGDPVISVVAVSPVTRFPDIARTRTERLAIHGKNRRADADGDCNADWCGWARAKRGRNGQERYREDQR